MNKLLYNLFIYISPLVFCIILFNFDYIKFPKIQLNRLLLLSILFLFSGFLGQAYSWKKTLDHSHCKTSFQDAIISIGLTIFGKYIPGKVWMIVGRSAYLSSKNKYKLSTLTLISLKEQFITIWAGITLGFLGSVLQKSLHITGLLIAVLSLFLFSLLIFNPFFQNLLLKLYHFLFKQELTFPTLSFREALKLLPWFGAYWTAWSIGFYLMALSFTDSTISIWSGLGFPLSGTIGILAFFAPGGIGVREGILAGYLTLTGLSLEEATTISIIARFWFLVGEVSLFLLSLILHYGNLRTQKNKFI